jgi:YihY family inner membrane protein
MNALQRVVARVDRFQQRKKRLAFAFAVFKKFGDDQAGNLAALIAYYGFLSIFPLMLVLVAVLGFVLRGDPHLQQQVIGSALGRFPVIGEQLKNNIKGLTGSGAGVALGVGTLLSLWAGLGVTQAAQNAFNSVWNVPIRERPTLIQARLRGLIMLLVLGLITVAATFVSGIGGGSRSLWVGPVSVAGTLVLNLALFMIAFRVLTDRDLSWADVFPGAATGAVFWTILQSLGSYIVLHQVKNASALYGTFGFIIALLGWIYLGAQITLYSAEVNVVRKQHLWPRSILTRPPLTHADRRTLEHEAKEEERIPEERVHVAIRAREDSARAGNSEERSTRPTGPTSPRGGDSARSDRPAGGAGAAALGAVVGLVFARSRRRRN